MRPRTAKYVNEFRIWKVPDSLANQNACLSATTIETEPMMVRAGFRGGNLKDVLFSSARASLLPVQASGRLWLNPIIPCHVFLSTCPPIDVKCLTRTSNFGWTCLPGPSPRPKVVISHILPPTIYTPERWETSLSQKPDIRHAGIYNYSVGRVLLKFPHPNPRPSRVLDPEFSLQSDAFILGFGRSQDTPFIDMCSNMLSRRSYISGLSIVKFALDVNQGYLYDQRSRSLSLFCIWIYHGLSRHWAYRTRKTVPWTGNWNLK